MGFGVFGKTATSWCGYLFVGHPPNFSVALWFACQKGGEQNGEEKDGKIFIVPTIPRNKNIDFFKVRSDELEENIDYFLHSNNKRKNKEEIESERKKRRKL